MQYFTTYKCYLKSENVAFNGMCDSDDIDHKKTMSVWKIFGNKWQNTTTEKNLKVFAIHSYYKKLY